MGKMKIRANEQMGKVGCTGRQYYSVVKFDMKQIQSPTKCR